MPVDLKVTLATVNYTDFLHVTASRVSAPGVIVWETWIDVPVTNYNFIIPNLDPANYYVRYYDAATNVALGTLKAELLVNALTGDTIYERRFYTVGGGNAGDPAIGDTEIVDPYLEGKNITGVFKEGFRYLKPTDEWTFTDATFTIEDITGATFALDEVFIVEIKYNVASTGGVSSGGLYTGTINVPEATRTLTAAEVNTRVRLTSVGLTQVITLPLVSGFAVEGGFYFDNSVTGLTKQVKILVPGTDRIRFNGFGLLSDLFTEFWISKGEHLLIKKYEAGIWEVITDYKGTNVGEKVTVGYNGHPGIIPEDGRLMDGDEYPRLWWWITNVLPSTHKFTPVTQDVTNPAFSFADPTIITKPGQFFVHATLKKFRMPKTTGLVQKGLKSFTDFGTDTTNRPVDYPGGYQAEMVGPHVHPFRAGRNGGIDGNANGGGLRQQELNPLTFGGYVLTNTGTENRVNNEGVIFGRRI